MIRDRPRMGNLWFGALLVLVGFAAHYLYGPRASQCTSTIGQLGQSLSGGYQQSCSSARLIDLASFAVMILGGLFVLIGVISAVTWSSRVK